MRKFEILLPLSLPLIFLSLALSERLHKRCTGAMSEEQEMELEAVCLSRLYFALNRIQGSLQIDKKKKEGNKHFGMFEKSKRYVYKKRQNEKEAQ